MTQDLNKENKAVKAQKAPTKKVSVKKVTLKQLEQAENNYILATNDLVHMIVGQDFSSKKITTKDKQERETQFEKFMQNVVSVNSLYIQFVYEKMQEVLKKNAIDVLQITYFVEEDTEEIKTEYDYFIEDNSENSDKQLQPNQKQYRPALDNETVNEFFQNMDETLDTILLELSGKVLTENGSIYLLKEQTLEQFKSMFDLNVLVQYTLEIDLAGKA